MWTDIVSVLTHTAVIYIMIVIGIRVLGKKELGELSITDLIFVMLISEAVGDVMRSTNDTLLGAFIAALTLIVVNKLFNILLYRSRKIRKIIDGNPSILVRHGKINQKEMKRNRITIQELEEAARQNGQGDIHKIGIAILEVDGKISILDDDRIKTEEPIPNQ